MKVICIGPCHEEILIPRQYLQLPHGDPLKRIAEGKFGLRDYSFEQQEEMTRFTLLLHDNEETRVRFAVPSSIRFSPGGPALTIAVGLARAGVEVSLITALVHDDKGRLRDFFTTDIETCCERHGIRLLHRLHRTTTPVTFVIWGGAESSTVFSYKPPYTIWGKIKKTLQSIRDEEGVTHLIAAGVRQTELDLVHKIFEEGKRRDPTIVTCFVASQSVLPLGQMRGPLKGVLEHTTVWQMNEQEAAIYLKGDRDQRLQFPDSVWEIARRIRSPRVIIVTRSEKGADAIIDGEHHHVDAFPAARIVDKCGAGDAFTAAFLFARYHKHHTYDALRLAAYAATGNIGAVGGHGGMPDKEALLSFLAGLQRTASPSASPPSSEPTSR